jgi:hypothetical protein
MIITNGVLAIVMEITHNYPIPKLTYTTDETRRLVIGDMAIETKRVSSQPVPL